MRGRLNINRCNNPPPSSPDDDDDDDDDDLDVIPQNTTKHRVTHHIITPPSPAPLSSMALLAACGELNSMNA